LGKRLQTAAGDGICGFAGTVLALRRNLFAAYQLL